MAFDYGGDCGVYNVGTLQRARRRGLGTALTAVHLSGAGARRRARKATPMAERVSYSVGFRDLGRILVDSPKDGPLAANR